jgi:type II secretory pathway component PulC
MPDGTRSKLPVIATVLAGVAVTCAVAAVIVTTSRSRDDRAGRPRVRADAAQPSVPSLIDRRVQAIDANKLRDPGATDIVIEAGTIKGVRVKDPALAMTLGFDTGDVLVGISGRTIKSERELSHALFMARTNRVDTLYVEMLRGTTPTLMRWRIIDGDLGGAPQLAGGTVGTLGLPLPSGLGGPGPGSAGRLAPTALDPLLDAIEEIDDKTYRLPRATLDAILADPYAILSAGRVVPSVKNGVPNGFKIYAIRPTSVLRRLGIQNGDTIHSIGGEELTSVADAAALVVKLGKARSIAVDVSRRGKPFLIEYEITK